MKSQIKSGAILSYLNMFVGLAVTVFYTPFMLKFMGQNEYGLYSLVTSVIAYLSVLDMGFGNAMIRFVAKNQAHGDNKKIRDINGVFLLLYILVGVVSLVIGSIIFINIDNLFGASLSPDELAKTKVIALILVATVSLSFPLSIFDSYAVASERFNYLKILEIIKHLAIPAVMIPILFMGGKSISMVIVTSVITLGFHIITMYYCFRKLKMRVAFKIRGVDKTLLKTIAFYSFWVFLGIIVDNLYNNTDQVILGGICGTSVVAIYAIAAKISSVNMNFSTAISGLFLPKIAKTLEHDDGDKKVSDIFIQVSRLQLYLMALVLSGFIVFGRAFISLWVGAEYLDAYYIVLLLIAPALIPLTQNICISIIQAKNKHQFRAVVYLIIAIINIAVSIPLAVKFGGIGAAIGTAAANVLGQIITMNLYYWKKIGIDIPRYWKNFLKFGAPVAALSCVTMFIVNNIVFSWLKLLIAVLIYGAAYMCIVAFFSNQYERSLFKKIVRFKKK